MAGLAMTGVAAFGSTYATMQFQESAPIVCVAAASLNEALNVELASIDRATGEPAGETPWKTDEHEQERAPMPGWENYADGEGGYNLGGLDPLVAALYKDQGLSPRQAVEWSETFSAEEARLLVPNMDYGEAAEWALWGINPESSIAYSEAGLPPEEAVSWADTSVPASSTHTWVDYEFEPDEAGDWYDIGIEEAETAFEWRTEGFTPRLAERYYADHFSAASAAKEILQSET